MLYFKLDAQSFGRTVRGRVQKKRQRKRLVPSLANAFVRVMSLHQSGSPDLKALIAKYKELRAHDPTCKELRQAKALVDKAKRSAIKLRKSKTLVNMNGRFGKKGREIRRASMAQQIQSRVESLRSVTAEMQSLRLGDMGSSIGGLNQLLKVARKVARTQPSSTFSKACRRESISSSLSWYADGPGKLAESSIMGTKLFDESLRLRAIPSTDEMQRFEIIPNSPLRAPDLLAAIAQSSTQLGTCIDKSWLQMHESIPSSNLLDEQASVQTNRCKAIGMCVCSPQGKLHWCLVNRYLGAVKSIFKRGTTLRNHLVDGRIFSRLVGREGEIEQMECIVHIGFQLLCPYRQSLHRVLRAEDTGELAARAGRIYVTQTCEFHVEMTLLKMLRADLHWTVQFYITEEIESACADVRPQTVPILPLEGVGPIAFWPPPRAACGRGVDDGAVPPPILGDAPGAALAGGGELLAITDADHMFSGNDEDEGVDATGLDAVLDEAIEIEDREDIGNIGANRTEHVSVCSFV